MKRRITAMFLAIALVCALLPAAVLTASANTYSGTCGDNLTWTLNDETGQFVISGTGAMYDWEEGGAPWYACRTGIKYVYADDVLTNIGDYAFFACDYLETVSLPLSVTEIGESAFENCHNLLFFDYPDTVTSIGENAFRCCDQLYDIELPEGLTTISPFTFAECTGLNSVFIPDSVTSIGRGAFHACINLQSVQYGGSCSEWNAISIDRNNEFMTDAEITCAYCDQNWVIPYDDPTDYCAPTCEEDGWYIEHCANCGASGNLHTLPATGHNWEADGSYPPTCTEGGYTFFFCPTCCGSRADYVAPLGHDLSYSDSGDGTHAVACSRCDYSQSEPHTFTDGVCVCGACETVEPGIDAAYPVLNEDINLTYAVNVPAGAEDPYMVFTYQGAEFTVTDYTVNADGQYCFTFTQITPQFLGETVTAVFHADLDGEDYTDTVAGYSIRQYCVNMMNNHPEDTALITLLSDLLTYGAAAQAYTGQQPDALVTNGLELMPSEFSSVSGKTAVFTGMADPAADWIGATLVLGSQVSMRFLFEAEDLNDLSVAVTCNGRETAFDAEDIGMLSSGEYYVDFHGIEANEFDESVTASLLRGGEPVGRSLSYSVNAYICGMQNTENESLRTLVRALYNYGVSAAAYSSAE